MKKDIVCETYFSCPIYISKDDSWITQLNKISDHYLNKKLPETKLQIQERNKLIGNVGDHGFSYHSDQMMKDKKLYKFNKLILDMSKNILLTQGYDLSSYKMQINELWVQEFSKNGGGHHDTHIHCNSHISGFYFLKCSDKTSYPIFHDPNQAKQMSQLPLKNEKEYSIGMDKVFYKPEPGMFMLFNSYMPHQFFLDDGVDPFRFIHFNIQAVQNEF
jgi:uncharacterized protein (TIGR02466 family)